jgi:hypothetical protein
MEHVGPFTITLVFTDGSSSDGHVICVGLDGVFEMANKHVLARHADQTLELSHPEITNQEGVVVARWEGVTVSG